MSIFTKQSLIASYPAYNVFEREADRTGFVNITANDILALDSGRGFHRTYRPGSAASYALQYNECPIQAYNEAVARNHATHWINARGSCITAEKRAAEDVVLVRYGMRVRFEGRLFTIEKDHNNNLRFQPVAA